MRVASCDAWSSARIRGVVRALPCRTPAIAHPPQNRTTNRQIALELGLSPSDVQAMTEHLRCGLVAKAPAARLEGEVEVDEVYVVAGHKGQPVAVAKRGGSDAVAGWPARRAGARWRRTSHPSSA